MFLKRVRNAASLTGHSLWFIKPGEQDNEKCHVVGQCQLTTLSVTFFETTTKTTIVRLVHIVVFEFHFSFVDCNISKHKKSLYLALLDKCCVTFRTADFNTAFAFWYTYFLFTSRTFVNVMCLSLCHYTFLWGEEMSNFRCFCQISLVLTGTFISLSWEHTEICVDQKCPAQQG